MSENKFYKLRCNTEFEEIGVWEQLRVPDKYWEVKNNFKGLDFWEFPSETPNLNYFCLKKGAVKTDFLSAELLSTSIGIFVSEKVKNILENHNCSGVQFYKSTLINLNDRTDFVYYFVHIIQSYRQFINPEKSIFIDFLEDEEVKIDISKPLESPLEPKHLVLKDSFDIFRNPGSVDLIISEKLKNALIDAGITGTFIEEIDSFEISVPS